jgi:TonB-dependent starch-binding outer membrane protein SusC
VDANIAEWLTFRSSFALNHSNSFQDQFTPIFDAVGGSSTEANIQNQRNVHTMLLFTQQLTFDQTFDRHHLNVVAVYEYEDRDNFNEQSSGNQDTNVLRTLAGAANIGHQTIRSETRMLSFVGRLSYGYDERYLVNLAFRRDGLSIWAPGNKWANFPSASLAWRIDRESFMRDQHLFSELKIRGGYGVTGLNGLLIGNSYPWQVALQASGATYPRSCRTEDAQRLNGSGSPRYRAPLRAGMQHRRGSRLAAADLLHPDPGRLRRNPVKSGRKAVCNSIVPWNPAPNGPSPRAGRRNICTGRVRT